MDDFRGRTVRVVKGPCVIGALATLATRVQHRPDGMPLQSLATT